MIVDSILEVAVKIATAVIAAAAILFLQSCEPDHWVKIYVPEEQNSPDVVEYVVSVSGTIGVDSGTRSILGTDSESNPFIKDSGYQVFAFNRRAGILEAVVSVDSRTASATIGLNRKDTYDFFVVGNLWFLDSAGKKTGWDVFFGKTNKYPAKAADMEDASLMPYYRFDGKAMGSTGLRTETFAEVASYGIPYSGKKEGVTYENSRSGVSVSVKRLFSKVTLTVDHSGLIGPSGNVNAFVNESIHLRQVNCRVHPFIEGLAASGEDILAGAADYETSPENGASKTFVFYVPENCGGSYTSVTKASDKKPSAAGSKSGCVTYLEFVGELKPELAGGYGGTLKYQFCLGGNATSDYNVVRNSNYKVTLGFKPESLFEDVDWKMDKGESLTDTRVLGLSADAAGTQRLKEDGTQVIAVRSTNISSKKKEMYLFFNHNGGTSNEVTSYVDEYSAGYKPADATRSAVKVTFNGSNADAVKCAYDKTTGKVSFWTDSPTALTAGHEYPVTFTLYPGGKTVSAVVKTEAPMEVKFNTAGMFVGMKRSLTPKGFCGGNLTLKVTSGGENILRYSNSAASDGGPGTDKYVTKSGVSLSGMSVPLYAYRPGSVTLSVSTDDKFNDAPVSVTVSVSKPYPCYDDIKENQPIWNPQTESVEYGHAIVLPFDGTPVDVPAYYTTNGFSVNKITVGTGENQFDPDVYAQLLDFVFTFTSDCVAKDPNTLKIYLQKWWVAPGCLFETYTTGTWESFAGLFYKVHNNKIEIAPRSTEIFPPSTSPEFKTYLTTLIPGFYDVTQREEDTYKGFKRTAWEKTDLESDYFNYWNSDWSEWTTVDKIKPDEMRAQWPKITNSIGFYLAGSSLSSITVVPEGDHDKDTEVESLVSNYLSTEFVGEGDAVRLKWKFAPGEDDSGISGTRTGGWAAPYGKQKVKIKIKNIHSGEVFPPEDDPSVISSVNHVSVSTEFTLRYETVTQMGFLFSENWEDYANYYFGAPTVMASKLFDMADRGLLPYGVENPLRAYVGQGVTYTSMRGIEGYVENYSPTVRIPAANAAWYRDGQPSGPDVESRYADTYFDAELAAYCCNYYCSSMVVYFQKQGDPQVRYDIPTTWYRVTDTRLADYITFTVGGGASGGKTLGYIYY